MFISSSATCAASNEGGEKVMKILEKHKKKLKNPIFNNKTSIIAKAMQIKKRLTEKSKNDFNPSNFRFRKINKAKFDFYFKLKRINLSIILIKF